MSRAELGGAIRSSVNSFLDPVRDTLPVCDVEKREDAKGNDQTEAERSCDHQLLFVFVFEKPVLPLGFLLFSKPICAFVDYRLPCAMTEAEVDQGGDLLPVFGSKFGVDCFSGY